MAQENNTARERTELEKLSQDALNQARRERKMIQDTCIAELAQCDTEIPEALEKQVQAEIASLQQAKENLSSAHKIASSTVDELSARAADVAKSLNRKWYRINPPSNTAIDVQEEEKSFFARGMNGYKIALIVFIGSFAGVMLELLWCFASHGYLESRSGLVWGPFNMLYGVGAASLSIILYRFRNRGKWLSFLGGFVVGSAVEYVCSWLQEVLFGSRSWDYSRVPFNINGRVCASNLLAFGVMGVFVVKVLKPFAFGLFAKIPPVWLDAITITLTALLIADVVISAGVLTKIRGAAESVRADNTEAITKAVREALMAQGFLLRHPLHAFPEVQFYNKAHLAHLKAKHDELQANMREKREKLQQELDRLEEKRKALKKDKK